MLKKLSTFIQLERYQHILDEKPILDFLNLHHLKKEDLFSQPYWEELKLIKKYSHNPDEKTKLRLFQKTSFKMNESKNLLFFYFLNKGLLSFNIRDGLNLSNSNEHLSYEFLKTPNNTLESLFSHVFMHYLEEFNNDKQDTYLTNEKKQWRVYLLECFNLACEYLTKDEENIILKNENYYWQSINMFYQPKYHNEMNEKIILPLIKKGLSLDYLKNPTFTQMTNFTDYTDSILSFIEQHYINHEKVILENSLSTSSEMNIKHKVKI